MLAAASRHQQLFFFASCQIQAEDTSKLDGTGDEYYINGLARRRQTDDPVEAASKTIDEVFSACGAAALYPREAYLQVGGFDEDFFNYLEDVDLGFRLRLAGYRCLYVPDARVLHVGSAALGKFSDLAIYYSQRNMIWTFLKNMPAYMVWIYLPVHLATNFWQALYYSVCCCPLLVLRAKLDALKGIPAVLRKRRKIQSNSHISPDEILRVVKFPTRRMRFSLKAIWLLPVLLIRFVQSATKCREARSIEKARSTGSVLPL